MTPDDGKVTGEKAEGGGEERVGGGGGSDGLEDEGGGEDRDGGEGGSGCGAPGTRRSFEAINLSMSYQVSAKRSALASGVENGQVPRPVSSDSPILSTPQVSSSSNSNLA
jgi:hypothetical protein